MLDLLETVLVGLNWAILVYFLAVNGFLLLRAFSSGCAALTGVEAISNGVPAFRQPKSRNAATTLLILGLISASMMLRIIGLSRLTGLQYVEDPARQIEGSGLKPGPSGFT